MSVSPLIYIPIAFLAGSIPTGLLIGKAKGIDIREHGSKNIGATNLGRVLGKKYFFICFIIDFAKGFVPPLLCGFALKTLGTLEVPASAAWIWLATMVAAVLGNVFNPWLSFKGGKGVATAIGALVGIFPALGVPGVVAFAAWITALKTWGYISAASIVAALMVPAATILMFVLADSYNEVSSWKLGLPFIIVSACISALVIFKHRANIARLRAGTEPKAGQRSA